jgi:hypothetical protein
MGTAQASSGGCRSCRSPAALSQRIIRTARPDIDCLAAYFAFPNMQVVIADAGHESRKLARELRQHDGYELQVVKRKH